MFDSVVFLKDSVSLFSEGFVRLIQTGNSRVVLNDSLKDLTYESFVCESDYSGCALFCLPSTKTTQYNNMFSCRYFKVTVHHIQVVQKNSAVDCRILKM